MLRLCRLRNVTAQADLSSSFKPKSDFNLTDVIVIEPLHFVDRSRWTCSLYAQLPLYLIYYRPELVNGSDVYHETYAIGLWRSIECSRSLHIEDDLKSA